MLIRFLIGLILCGSLCPIQAQKSKSDSLLKLVRTQSDDTNKVNTLNLLARQVQLLGKYDSCMLVARDAISLARKIGFTKGEANGYNNVGNTFFMLSRYDSSLVYHRKSLQLQTEVGNKVGIASSNNNMGNIYFMQGNYPAALNSYLAARSMYDVLSQTDSQVRINLSAAYNNIGNVNLMMKNYDSALANYNQSLRVRLLMNDKHGAAACYGNIGSVYMMQHVHDKALWHYNESIRYKQQIDDEQGIGETLGNIGLVYYEQKEFEKALENFYASARIADSLDDVETLANAYSNIGQTLVNQGKPSEAISFLEKSLQIGKESDGTEILKNSYNGLYRADSALGKWEEAYRYLNLFIQYRDQLLNDEKTREVVSAQMTYEFEKEKTRQEAIQLAELQRERFIRWIIIGAIAVVFLITLLTFTSYRQRQKRLFQQKLNEQQKQQANAVMETQESERKRIAEDLHDSLGHLLSTAKMHLQTVPDTQKHYVDNSLQLLNQASEEIRSITFNLMPHTLEEAGLIPALHELAAKVTKTGKVQVNLHVHNIERFNIEKQSQFNIYRIVQEAVNNIIKHADASNIDIQLVGLDDNLSIVIEDDGKGFDTTTRKSGRGLKNIVTRSLWLKGHINIDSFPGRGTTITTEIPM